MSGDTKAIPRRRASEWVFKSQKVYRNPFARMRPAPELLSPGEWEPGCRPLILATEARDVVAVYLPALGAVCPTLPADRAYDAQWYDPCTGECFSAEGDAEDGWLEFIAPLAFEDGHLRDWVLVLHERTFR